MASVIYSYIETRTTR